MATRSMIGMSIGNKIKAVYCHCDGYLDYNGVMLLKHYNNANLVKQLIALGDLSSLGETIDTCVAYHRDRGEDLHFSTYSSPSSFVSDAGWDIEYKYLFNNGDWYVQYFDSPEWGDEWHLLNYDI